MYMKEEKNVTKDIKNNKIVSIWDLKYLMLLKLKQINTLKNIKL